MVLLRAFWLIAAITLLSPISLYVEGYGQAPLSSSSCSHPPYTVHVFSKSPLVIYISDFLTAEEATHLQEITKDIFTQSLVSDQSGSQGAQHTRNSQSTTVPRDSLVRCIETRALEFQGFDVKRTQLEPLQLVQYGTGQNYQHHTDWFEAASRATPDVGGNRLTSFFAYVATNNLTGGGTNFPVLDAPRDERWCRFVDCDEPRENGVTFRPVPGNAIFWQNLHEDGSGDRATLHAGLPVTSGTKLGMNIWTRQGPLKEEFRGPDIDVP